MALETGTYINSLVATNPAATDPKSQGDDHLRLIKSTILSTFPSITGAVTATHTELSRLAGVTSTAVGISDTQTLTNKTIEAGVFTNGYTEEVATANTGTAYTIDLLNGTVQVLTLTGNVIYTFPTPTAGRSFILLQKQDGTGNRTVSWPGTVKWPGGTAPSITAGANKLDKFTFVADGTNWYGTNAGQNYTV
jgi:hypothetical protein